jgi:hypothetical protein
MAVGLYNVPVFIDDEIMGNPFNIQSSLDVPALAVVTEIMLAPYIQSR